MKFGSHFYLPLCHDIRGNRSTDESYDQPPCQTRNEQREKWQFFLLAAWIREIANIRKISLWLFLFDYNDIWANTVPLKNFTVLDPCTVN